MTTLQEYLNQKYPTKEEKEKLKEIDIYKFLQEEKEQERKTQERAWQERHEALELGLLSYERAPSNEKLEKFFQSFLLNKKSGVVEIEEFDKVAPLKLEGGELDLSEFTNVEVVDISRKL